MEGLSLSAPPAPGVLSGLYVHLPFCDVKCRFCDFAAYPGRRADLPRYLTALDHDLRAVARAHPGRSLDTVYFGGGTPTVLSPEETHRVTASVRGAFAVRPDAEISVEANPEGATFEKLEAWRAAGANRLSVGLQTDDDVLLRSLGRQHTAADFDSALRSARRAGFDNINVDLMYGLPGQTRAGWEKTVRAVAGRGTDHVSAYGLTVEEATYFHRSGVRSDEDLQADFYDIAADLLEGAGFEHYEISNFARPGRACRHNLRYWRNQECLAAGVSAAGYADGVRRTNPDRLNTYLDFWEGRGVPGGEETVLTPGEKLGEDLMLGLRLKEGVAETPEARRHYGPVLDRFTRLGFLERTERGWRPTRRGWRLSNQLFLHFLEPVA